MQRFLLIYVDDVILTRFDPKVLQQLIHNLHKEFALKDLGPLNYSIGLAIHKLTNGNLFLNQRKKH